MEKVILNSDVGENESDFLTESVLRLVDAANISCGVHAGSVEKTRRTIRAALEHGCVIGAHPGLSAVGGRGTELPDADAFKALLFEQMDSFTRLLEEEGGRLGYIKLHGSLYHGVESVPELSDVFLNYLSRWGKEGVGVFTRAGGNFAEEARAEGLQVFEELFADRGYLPDGRLVSRGAPGAVLDSMAVKERIALWLSSYEVTTTENSRIRLHADTICVHADTKDALEMAQQVRYSLDGA
jgi:UPF0271 protein